ncbi:fibrillin-2-like protein, partial [Leptotrombidium deliense]
ASLKTLFISNDNERYFSFIEGEESNVHEVTGDEPEIVNPEDYDDTNETDDDKQSNSISSCMSGQKYNEESKKCEDDNLCDSLKNPCGEIMECEPVSGSFKCHMKKFNNTHCPEGYKFINHYCDDINECEDQSKCAKPKVCNNYEGGYNCIDINENSNPVDESHTPFFDNSIDSNVDGCDKGYRLDEEDAECSDIDECLDKTHNCTQGTTCKNTDGSFICEHIKCEEGKSVNIEGKCVDSSIQQSCSP